jgi:hypothetical protein
MRTTHTQIKRHCGRPRNTRTTLTTSDIEAANVRKFAHDAGYDLEALAFALGVTYSSMRVWGNGHKPIPNKHIEKLARLLDVYPQQIRPTYQPSLEGVPA